MATCPAAGLDARYARIGRAAFALARRICGDDAAAADVVEQAFASAGDGPEGAVGDGLLLRRVRDLACDRLRRVPLAPVALSDPPRELAELPAVQWRVLDLVALRGATVREAAVRLRLPEEAVLAHLRDGLRLTGQLLSGARETDDHTDSPRLALLR
jgi:DNA-directed RNA polymerase specialized sigma24 family protein